MTINLNIPIWCDKLPRELPVQIEFTTAITIIHVEINNFVAIFICNKEGRFKSECSNDVDAGDLSCIESQLNVMFGEAC